MSKWNKLIIIILLLGSISTRAEMNFSTITIEQGLSGNPTRAIFQDHQGFMWFGTNEGLDRFDGLDMRSFNSSITNQPLTITALLEDSLQNLLVGTSTGIWIKKRKTDTFSPLFNDSTKIYVNAIGLWGIDHSIATTNQGIFLINNLDFSYQHILLSDQPNSLKNQVTAFCTNNDQSVWLATKSGLLQYNILTRSLNTIEDVEVLNNEYFTDMISLNNNLYLGTKNHGVYQYQPSTKKLQRIENLNNYLILSLKTDHKNNIFIGTDGGGLNIFNTKTRELKYEKHRQNDPSSISANAIYSIHLDNDGRIWMGTYSGGVNYAYIENRDIQIYTPKALPIIKNESIRSFLFTDDNLTLVGTRDGLYAIDDATQEVKSYKSNFNDNSGLRANIILTIQSFNNRIFIGTYGGGISIFDKKTKQIIPFHAAPELLHGNIYDFKQDSLGQIWIASTNGLFLYNPEGRTLKIFSNQNSELNNNETYSLMIDHQNLLWVGTSKGVEVFNTNGNELNRLFIEKSEQEENKINYIYQDSANNIWVCSESGGISKYAPDLKKIINITKIDGLPNSSVCAITQSSADIFWLSTLKGLAKFNQRDTTIQQFGMADGLPSMVFTPAAVLNDQNEKIWLGTEKGLISFTPNQLKRDTTVLPPVITDVYLFGKKTAEGEIKSLTKPIEFADTIQLNPNQNSIGFRFVNFNYNNLMDASFQYQLEGYDEDWKEIVGSNNVNYSKLPTGKYLFKIKQAAHTTDHTDFPETRLVIIIKPSIYKHPLFFVSLFLLLTAIGIFFYKHILKTTNELKTKLEKLTTDKEKYVSSKLPQQHVTQIKDKIIAHMEKEKPFLNPDLKMSDIASSIGFSSHELSQVINQELQLSFPDFINSYRVEEVKKRMQTENLEKFTLVAIAEQCGFKSKTSFYRNFKKVVGITPAEYSKNIQP